MRYCVDAVFENGVLRPLTPPLRLRPCEQVRVVVLRQSDPSRWNLKRLAAAPDEDRELAQAGLNDWTDALASDVAAAAGRDGAGDRVGGS